MRALTGERLQVQAVAVSPEMWGRLLRGSGFGERLRVGRRLASTQATAPPERVGFVEVARRHRLPGDPEHSSRPVSYLGSSLSTLLMTSPNLGVADTHNQAQDDGTSGHLLAGSTP